MKTKQHPEYKGLPFYKCPKKFEDRQVSIIDVYRDIFGKQRIPDNEQYWCICAQQCDKENPKREPMSECLQMINSGLILPKSWRGVDWEEDLILRNKKIYPELIWIHSELRAAIAQAWRDDDFHPAIINCDLLTMQNKSCTLISSVLTMLMEREITNCMIVMNSVLATRHYREAESNLSSALQDHVIFLQDDFDFANALINKGWRVYPKGYIYKGTGKSTSTMGSVILFKKDD